jgi:hypothetical protein
MIMVLQERYGILRKLTLRDVSCDGRLDLLKQEDVFIDDVYVYGSSLLR